MKDLVYWENEIVNYLRGLEFSDSSHDLAHFKRVWHMAKSFSDDGADLLVILAASYFHDLVSYPKNHPDRALSSRHAADKAVEILEQMSFPKDKLGDVAHAIEAHSYSANIRPLTHEAMVVQDADRMESLGCIGIARTFYVSGLMKGSLFNSQDPFAQNRSLDDKNFAVDHFYTKLLKLEETILTSKARALAKKRSDTLRLFLNQLKEELLV
ncbi:HD domain-containing protein [Halobacteriovorax sp. HLS]|uniref:HD domain-containing protein n=1 Tax=Halobacteriovorax sp. HLS TaxID=2234000 RepID=UPI000FD72E36|nr:HD domain-containing protein [Halobacteriovorax sp. HLS]